MPPDLPPTHLESGAELAAMARIAGALDGLDTAARGRVLAWVESYYRTSAMRKRPASPNGYQPAGQMIARVSEALAAGGRMTPTEVWHALGGEDALSRQSVKGALWRMYHAGLVERERGSYMLPDAAP